jgi:hypothetical protein
MIDNALINNTDPDLPPEVVDQIQMIMSEVNTIVYDSSVNLNEPHLGNFNIRYQSDKPQPFLTLEDKTFHTITSFILKFEELNIENELSYDNVNNSFEVKQLRGFLNEIRPIVFNQNDDVYYENAIDALLILLKREGTFGLEISYISDNQNINDDIKTILRNKKKKIKYILSKSDLDFLYNGVLQHSDRKYKKRLIEEQENNALQLTIIKSYLLLIAIIGDLLFVYQSFVYLKGFGIFQANETDEGYIYP